MEQVVSAQAAAASHAPGPEEEVVGDGTVPHLPELAPGGERSGLALFVPGTKRLKRGLVVPEGFELPPGYVRHYQVLDDGTELPAVLLFHPDHQPLDAQGRPIPVPEDRIVPPELAPPGMPYEELEVPEGAEPPPP
jgi:hypothetical protein